MGVRPLYYRLDRGTTTWSTSLAEIVLREQKDDDISEAFVARFMTLDAPCDVAPYDGIQVVPAGGCVSVTCDGVQRHRVWRLECEHVQYADRREYEERLLALWTEAIGCRLRANGLIWAELSGGLDSSSVLCTAVELAGVPQQAVSCVYTDNVYDERNEIRDVLANKVAHWYPIEIGNRVDVTSIVARQVRMHDEPVATARVHQAHVLTSTFFA